MTDRTSKGSRRGWTAAVVAATAAILAMTLSPDSTVNSTNFVPLREHGAAWSCLVRQCSGAAASAEFLIKDVIGNVVVFMPIGFAGAAALLPMAAVKRFGLVVAGGALLSLFIETVQFGMATRAADVDDLIFNTIGTAIGAGLLLLSRRWSPR